MIDNAQVRFAKSYLTNFECKPESFLEVVDVAVVSEFTGYDRRTVGQWIRTGKLNALTLPQKYVIPKCYLID